MTATVSRYIDRSQRILKPRDASALAGMALKNHAPARRKLDPKQLTLVNPPVLQLRGGGVLRGRLGVGRLVQLRDFIAVEIHRDAA